MSWPSWTDGAHGVRYVPAAKQELDVGAGRPQIPKHEAGVGGDGAIAA